MRNLIVVLGDQLDPDSAGFDDAKMGQDQIWMAEVHREATHVWCHKLRLAVFFSAMRHCRDEFQQRGWMVHYQALTADPKQDQGQSFGELLDRDLPHLKPQKLIVLEPGDWRVREELLAAAARHNLTLEIRADRHFYCTIEDFQSWAKPRRRLILEDFYRFLRRRENVLMEADGEPVGGEWNLDAENRQPLPKSGPLNLKPPTSFPLDAVTREVIEMVESRFAGHPGSCDHFDLPLTKPQAKRWLDEFIEQRLPTFGSHQDAMWTGEPFLSHSRLSVVLNLHLLDPRECVDAAVNAYHDGLAPLNSVEGFVRQILGWREYVRGIYWQRMPDYAELNALECDPTTDVPWSFWDGNTEMSCVRDAMQGVLEHGYAHHIQRLMVLGLFAQLAGVHPRKFHEWHMAMYVDAIDWVSLPNTLGMSQFGDGGIVGTKPYCASGNYIHKMSNYCRGCRYDYRKATGEDACPLTTLYWDFLARHQELFAGNPRMRFQMSNLGRKPPQELAAIREAATELLARLRHGDSL